MTCLTLSRERRNPRYQRARSLPPIGRPSHGSEILEACCCYTGIVMSASQSGAFNECCNSTSNVLA